MKTTAMHPRLTPPPSSPYIPYVRPTSHLKDAGSSPIGTPKVPQADPGDTISSLANTSTDKSLKSQSTPPEFPWYDHASGRDGDLGDMTLPVSLPPILHHLSACTRRARTKFTPYHKPRGPSSLELRFTEKSLGRIDNDDFTLEDTQTVEFLVSSYLSNLLIYPQGRNIFVRGLLGLPDEAFHEALAAKEADRETKRFCALATAWEIESLERKRNLLLATQKEHVSRFLESSEEVKFFHKLLRDRSSKELEDSRDFNIGAYRHDLTSLSVEEERLDQMHEARHMRTVKEPAAPGSEDRLAAILAATLPSSDEEE